MYKFKITLGDPSDDGHGKTETYIIQSNRPLEEVRKAYSLACRISGIKFHNEICADYEDHSLSKDQIEKFENIGINVIGLMFGNSEYDPDYEDSGWLEMDTYVELLLCFITLYTSELKLIIVSDELEDFEFYDDKYGYISHFGYGLFD